jgi:hypothetical protein
MPVYTCVCAREEVSTTQVHQPSARALSVLPLLELVCSVSRKSSGWDRRASVSAKVCSMMQWYRRLSYPERILIPVRDQ